MRLGLACLVQAALGSTVVAVSLAAAACGEGQVDGSVRLDDTVDVASVRALPESARQDQTLRIAIAGVMSPSRTLNAYERLVAYMQSRLGMQVTIDQRSSYAEVNDLVRTGQADIAFVCSRAYLEGQAEFGLALLLAPEVNGEATYYSYLIVPSDSPARSLADLRGRAFAFSDPLSNSGRLVPEYVLYQAGETPSSFFGRLEYTGSHDNSVLAVAGHLVDGAAVDSLVYDYLVARNPEIAQRTRIIARWGPYGIPPLTVSPALDVGVRERVRAVLLEMDKDVEGQTALAELGVDRFVPIEDSAYDAIRAMLNALKGVAR